MPIKSAVVQGARIGGARQIIGVDVFDSKLEMAKRVGATHVVNSGQDDPVKAVRDVYVERISDDPNDDLAWLLSPPRVEPRLPTHSYQDR